MTDNSKTTMATVIPTMRYIDAPAAIEWLCEAFGFEKHLLVPGEDGTIVHAQLVFGNGMVMLGSARESEFDNLQKPPSAPGGTVSQSPVHHRGRRRQTLRTSCRGGRGDSDGDQGRGLRGPGLLLP